MKCNNCGKWAGAHAILPGQPRDHLCTCPKLEQRIAGLVEDQQADSKSQKSKISSNVPSEFLKEINIAFMESFPDYFVGDDGVVYFAEFPDDEKKPVRSMHGMLIHAGFCSRAISELKKTQSVS